MGINFKAIAACIAANSKDPKYKVGAVIFDANNNIISTGYNGAPRGVSDVPARYTKPLKQYYIAHAEENAIVQAACNGHRTDGGVMLIYGKPPCSTCTRMIIQAGIKAVIFEKQDIAQSNYFASFQASLTMLKEARVSITYLEVEHD